MRLFIYWETIWENILFAKYISFANNIIYYNFQKIISYQEWKTSTFENSIWNQVQSTTIINL